MVWGHGRFDQDGKVLEACGYGSFFNMLRFITRLIEKAKAVK